MKIYDHKIFKDAKKIGWVDGIYIRAEDDGNKMGYFENGFIYNTEGRKIAYIHENELMFESGQSPISLEHINESIEGAVPLLEKAAVYVLMEE